MYVVIVGAGEVGTYLAHILSQEGHDVAVIDSDEKVLQGIATDIDALVVHGNGASRGALEEARIRSADLFIAVTNLDEVNMFSCMAAKKLARPRAIARVRDRRYQGEAFGLDAEDLGIDHVLGAEQSVAEHIERLFKFPGLSSYDYLAGGRLVIIETAVRPRFSGLDRSLSDLNVPRPGNLIAIQRQDEFLIPKGDTVIREGDQIWVLTVPDRVEDYLRFFGHPRLRVHKVLVVGGGVIGFHTASYLEEHGHSVTIVEADSERARWISQRLSRSIVLQADATKIVSIREQLLDGADAVAVLMKEEEKALLIGMYAKYIGASQVVTRVDDFAYAPIAYKMGIDSLISPQRALAQSILERIRRGQVARAMMLGNNQVEILEFSIPAEGKSDLIGVPIAELDLPKGCLLGGILREGPGENVLIPRGSDVIQPGDHVIVSVHPDAIGAVERLFA